MASSSRQPLAPLTSADDGALLMIFAQVRCDEAVLAEALLADDASVVKALRLAVSRTGRKLSRAVSFCSQDEKVSTVRDARRQSALGSVGLGGRVAVHTLRRHGHIFTVVTHPSVEAELASRFCEEACASFASASMANAELQQQRPPQGLAAATQRTAARSAYEEQLRALMRQHSSPERLARYRRVVDIMEATSEVGGVLEESVERMLATSSNLSVLEDKSEWLLAQANQFRKSTRELKRTMWCKWLKVSLLAFFAVALAGAFVTLTVMGKFKFLFGGDTNSTR